MRLGPLQRTVLTLAYRNRKNGGREHLRYHPAHTYPDVAIRDVLMAYYGFEPRVAPASVRVSGSLFDREDIGLRRYMSGYVSVARCFGSLERMGLLERRRGGGVNLTAEGIKVAKKLS